MRLLLIHGAGASSLSWRAFRARVGIPCETFDYDVSRPFDHLLYDLLEEVDRTGATAVVGHSFGGILAWHAADECQQIRWGASVSSPWGGSRYSDIVETSTLGLLPTRFFSNIMRSSRHSRACRERPCRVPWLNVVTTKGIAGIGKNDGVLTVASQDALYASDSWVMRIEAHYSHTEVLFTDDLPDYVGAFARHMGTKRR